MLSLLLTKMDLSDPAVLKLLKESHPAKWDGGFQGLHALIYKGVRSSTSMVRSLAVMERLIKLPSGDIVGSEERLLFTVLANLPRYLHHFDDDSHDPTSIESAETLANAAESLNYVNISRALQGFAKARYRNEKDLLSQIMTAIRTAFFPALEFRSLVFLLGMVNNQTDWFKVKTMQVLCVMVPDIDMRKPEIACQGPDLISPLLSVALGAEKSVTALLVLRTLCNCFARRVLARALLRRAEEVLEAVGTLYRKFDDEAFRISAIALTINYAILLGELAGSSAGLSEGEQASKVLLLTSVQECLALSAANAKLSYRCMVVLGTLCYGDATLTELARDMDVATACKEAAQQCKQDPLVQQVAQEIGQLLKN